MLTGECNAVHPKETPFCAGGFVHNIALAHALPNVGVRSASNTFNTHTTQAKATRL